MATVGEFQARGSGDIGGIAVAKFHVTLGAGTTIDPPTGTSVGNAIKALFDALKVYIPSVYTWAVQPTWEEFDQASGVIQRSGAMTATPAPTVGTGVSQGAGGNGARMYWHTTNVRNRRVVRGATYITPFVGSAYATNMGLLPATAAAVAAAGNAYIAAFTPLGASPVVWSKPATGTSTGVTSVIVSASCSTTPGSLRSRRS